MIQLTDTVNIFSKEKINYSLFEEKDKHLLPSTKMWDYKKKISVEDVDLWEVIYEIPEYIGVYAAYKPMCEFYMIVPGVYLLNSAPSIEFYYGFDAEKQVYSRCKSLGIILETQTTVFSESQIPTNFYKTSQTI